MKRQAQSHLLTGAFDPDERVVAGKRRCLRLLRGLAQARCRHGKYAVTILHHVDNGDLAMIGVEDGKDAVRIARTVRARNALCFGAWLSHRSFTLDGAAYRRIALAMVAR